MIIKDEELQFDVIEALTQHSIDEKEYYSSEAELVEMFAEANIWLPQEILE
jgi:hypothetical protein